MRKHVICGTMFDGLSGKAKSDQTIVIDDDRISYSGPSGQAPHQKPGEPVIDSTTLLANVCASSRMPPPR